MVRVRAWLGVGVLVAACGYSRPKDIVGDSGVPSDEAPVEDAEIDAMEIDAMESVLGAPCDPTDATSCSGTNNRCAWFVDQETPTRLGHSGCAPAGTLALGAACTEAAVTTGPSACPAGSECAYGSCMSICQPEGTIGTGPACDANHACTIHSNYFEVASVYTRGLCMSRCDPLTQDLAVGTNKIACGSPIPTAPSMGCYGFSSFVCTSTETTPLTATDRQPPRTNSQGNPFLNGCAPGFIPLFYSMTGSTQALCTGFCAALETDNTAAHMNNGLGNTAAFAKLPTQPAPIAGNGTCAAGKKGSVSSSRCKFIWPFLEDQGELPDDFEASPLLDTLGVCMAISFFSYDHDQNTGTPNIAYPDCNTLPPRSAATPGDADDAADWGCLRLANSMQAPALRDLEIITTRPPLVRHVLE